MTAHREAWWAEVVEKGSYLFFKARFEKKGYDPFSR